MNHFKKLTIKNFQSHIHTELVFHPGLNVFVGPSDSGKSAILRALRWLLFNTPRGTDFIRVGSDRCEVILELSDGTIIRRIRNHHSINRYQLERIGEEPQVFEGFGSEVPLEIVQAHQITPLRLEQRDIYLQVGHQLEGPFLLSESSGVKAKTIGLVSGAHLIDRALKQINSDRTQLTTKQKFLLQQQKNIEEKLEPFSNLDELETCLLSAEKKANEIRAKYTRLLRLQQLAEKYRHIQQEKRMQREIIAMFPRIHEAEQCCIMLENKLLYFRQYRQLAIRYQLCQAELQKQQEIVVRTTHIPELDKQHHLLIEKASRLRRCRQLHVAHQYIQEQRQQLDGVLQQTYAVTNGERQLTLLGQQRERLFLLKQLQQQWSQITLTKQRSRKILVNVMPFLEKVATRLPVLEEKVAIMLQLQTYCQMLMVYQQRIAKGKLVVQEADVQLHQYIRAYGDVLAQHGECPVCGSEINEKVITHVLQELEGGSIHAAAGRED
jgi:exonuclease SbcC